MVEAETNPQHPEGLTEARENLCLQLFEIGAIKFGNFRLKLHDENPEAPFSPIYIDLRVLRRFPEAKRAAVDVYEELARPLIFDLLADVPTAATPLVSSLSDRLQVGMVTPRTDTKTYGSGAKIDGALEEDKGRLVLVFDDLITTAASKLEAVQILRDGGYVVEDVVVLIDREQGGREQLEQAGLKLHAAFTMRQMLEFYRRIGKVTAEQLDDIKGRLEVLNAYLKIP